MSVLNFIKHDAFRSADFNFSDPVCGDLQSIAIALVNADFGNTIRITNSDGVDCTVFIKAIMDISLKTSTSNRCHAFLYFRRHDFDKPFPMLKINFNSIEEYNDLITKIKMIEIETLTTDAYSKNP
jgi:hypothetical protein